MNDSALPRERHQVSILVSWLQLLRISALPTAVSNILAGFLIGNGTWLPTEDLLLLILASCCLYMSGMVLNDWWDKDVDKRQRPDRPIPSGRISPKSAFLVYLFLTFCGVGIAAIVSIISVGICIGLVVCIALYDCVFKKTSLAPWFMGICRSLNLLLGASSAVAVGIDSPSIFQAPTILIAASLGVFIAGVTWFARDESNGGNRRVLVIGASLMTVGIAGYIAAPLIYDLAASSAARIRYIAIVSLIGLPIAMRAYAALRTPIPANIGVTIGTALRSLIMFDAALAYLFSQCQIMYPVAILLLLIPSLLLARWVSPT